MKRKFKATSDNIIFKVDPEVFMSDGGIHYSKYHEETPCWGEVISVGPEVKEFIEPGMRIRATNLGGTVFWDDSKNKYISCPEEHLLYIEE